ncbi:MAG: UDP-N-acetylglucosamine 2-epimerase [Chloroflexi bacterium RBG_16_57_11]|nr:MAG: UDP-N-acetylglucosamine 2-epimerase [Chloroflexi bacterium RBG_16_57_11]
MKILVVIGTRPEAIKMAPVIRALQSVPDQVDISVCSTGQHRQMLDQVLSLFHIRPDVDLNLMRENQTPSQVAAGVLSALDPLLAEMQPDWMLVQGDTTTVMAATIAAFNRKVRVAHVEAGLRTYDRENPFPEEMNRVVADHVSDLHFAPTLQARAQLLAEGIPARSIFVTGNTVIDALLWAVEQPLTETARQELLDNHLIRHVQEDSRHLILVTAHRRENHGEPIRQICHALRNLAQARPGFNIVYPVHRNPNIWEPVHELLDKVPGITLTPPLDYLTLIHLMKRCVLILTDSGGIQEEAPSLGVPVLVLRKTTERPEAVAAGAVRLVGVETDAILQEVDRLLDDPLAYQAMAQAINPYGDGLASERIVDVLLSGRCNEFVAGDRQPARIDPGGMI